MTRRLWYHVYAQTAPGSTRTCLSGAYARRRSPTPTHAPRPKPAASSIENRRVCFTSAGIMFQFPFFMPTIQLESRLNFTQEHTAELHRVMLQGDGAGPGTSRSCSVPGCDCTELFEPPNKKTTSIHWATAQFAAGRGTGFCRVCMKEAIYTFQPGMKPTDAVSVPDSPPHTSAFNLRLLNQSAVCDGGVASP